jgi:hypothetical protein
MRIFAADCGAEEFEEMLAGFIAGGSDDGRHRKVRWQHGGDNLDARSGHKCVSELLQSRTHHYRFFDGGQCRRDLMY